MSDNSAIEWTDASWNPLRARNLTTGRVGWYCEHKSDGCAGCYAEGFNMRLGTGLPFKPGHRKDVEIFLDEKTLAQPMRWKRPRMIFVCSMSDLFADFVEDAWLDKVFAVAALCPQHTFQVLTKRPERMRAYMSRDPEDRLDDICHEMRGALDETWHYPAQWPLPNVWLGVSCERQEEADERIPLLLNTPAAVRFVSLEPLLGPINLDKDGWLNWIGWAIVGGESGPKARPMHPQWARDLRDQCVAAGVAFFHKQNGEFRESEPGEYPSGAGFTRVGKKAAGRLLDGREWNEMPHAHHH